MIPPLKELALVFVGVHLGWVPLFASSALNPITNYCRAVLGIQFTDLLVVLLDLESCPGVDEREEALVNLCGL